MNARVLVIDDEAEVRNLLVRILTRAGFEVIAAEDGATGLRRLYQDRPDAIVLDVTMPGMDGWQTLERIRDLSDVPVVMLSGRGEELEKVRGLRLGADDYVAKPFGRQEIVARVESLLRRRRFGAGPDPPERYEDGVLVVDAATRSVTVGGRAVELTPLEFRLLTGFVRNAGRVMTHEDLSEVGWPSGGPPASRDQIKVYVGYLRRKLNQPDGPAVVIETRRGHGYRYVPADAAVA